MTRTKPKKTKQKKRPSGPKRESARESIVRLSEMVRRLQIENEDLRRRANVLAEDLRLEREGKTPPKPPVLEPELLDDPVDVETAAMFDAAVKKAGTTKVKLTDRQFVMLRDLADDANGTIYYKGNDINVARNLEAKGLVRVSGKRDDGTRSVTIVDAGQGCSRGLEMKPQIEVGKRYANKAGDRVRLVVGVRSISRDRAREVEPGISDEAIEKVLIEVAYLQARKTRKGWVLERKSYEHESGLRTCMPEGFKKAIVAVVDGDHESDVVFAPAVKPAFDAVPTKLLHASNRPEAFAYLTENGWRFVDPEIVFKISNGQAPVSELGAEV